MTAHDGNQMEAQHSVSHENEHKFEDERERNEVIRFFRLVSCWFLKVWEQEKEESRGEKEKEQDLLQR